MRATSNRRHRHTAISLTVRSIIACPLCEQVFPQLSIYNQRIRVHFTNIQQSTSTTARSSSYLSSSSSSSSPSSSSSSSAGSS
eukprot:6712092-Heterocapsa_arctica.AAC.1